jgi:hypothetical protein
MTKRKVFVAIPTMGTVADAQSYFWREAEALYGDKVEFIWPKLCIRRVWHDFARNSLVDEFLASEADTLFFLDSDVVPQPEVFSLLDKEWDLAGAPYPVFITPAGSDRPQVVYTVYQGIKNGNLGAANVPDKGTAFVDGLATGCLFIKRDVFAKLSKPYFEHKFDPVSRQLIEGEDLGFCKKVNALGYKFFVDFSLACRHYKTVCLLDVNNYAMDYTRKSIEAYDASVRAALRNRKV